MTTTTARVWAVFVLGLGGCCMGGGAPPPTAAPAPAPPPTVAPPSASVVAPPVVPFTGAREDFPAEWTSLPSEAPRPTAAQEASDFAHVTVSAYAAPHFTASPDDPVGEFIVPSWMVGSPADASTLADASVADARANYPSSGAYLVLPNAVLLVAPRYEASLTAHLASRGVVVARSIWPWIAADDAMVPASWRRTTGDDLGAGNPDVDSQSETLGAHLETISHRSFATEPGGPATEFAVTYYLCANLGDATTVGAALAAALSPGDAVRVGPSAAIVLPASHVEELAATYRAHGLELQVPAPAE